VVRSKLTRDEVLRIAELARLTLSDDEVELFTRQLADILRYAEEVQRADTSGVSPTSHVVPLPTVFREDEPQTSLERTAVVDRAPGAVPDVGLFKVPKVL
jgi:aspartyl-tRNA(Asn)/glutamyl-tRNA(Gln) amidotransferase subunit C